MKLGKPINPLDHFIQSIHSKARLIYNELLVRAEVVGGE